jgi:cytochrome c2
MKKCAKCHAISRAEEAQKDGDGWAITIKRMQAKAGSDFTPEEGGKIASFLSGWSAFKAKCAKCHTLDRTNVQKTMVQWQNTVDRMQTKQTGWISDADKKSILFYLTDVRLLELE